MTTIPAYMIPASINELDALPMTVGGKLDRRQLPAPDMSFTSATEYSPPVTETEIKLAKIWEDVLSTDKVGIHDNFFNLGGHSLMATQVMSRIQTVMQVKLPLSTLFRHPSVAELAKRIDEQVKISGISDVIERIERADVEIDPAYLEEMSDQQIAKLLGELAGSTESEL